MVPALLKSTIEDTQPRGRFGRQDRLRTGREFDRVFRRGRRQRGLHMAIVVGRASGDRSRLGLAISRGAGNSPCRARLRRLCREAFRALRSGWPKPVDVVVMIRTPWPNAAMQDVRGELDDLMRRLRWSAI